MNETDTARVGGVKRVRVLPGMLEVAGRERDEIWQASVRRDRELKRQELDAERYRYHADHAERLRRTMTQLVEHHEREARRLLKGKS
jgi:hypothetical protein